MALIMHMATLERNGTAYTGSAPTWADRKVRHYQQTYTSSSVLIRQLTNRSDLGYRVNYEQQHSFSLPSRPTWPTRGYYIFWEFTDLDTDTNRHFTNAKDVSIIDVRIFDTVSPTFRSFSYRTGGVFPFVRVANSIWATPFTVSRSASVSSFRNDFSFDDISPARSRISLATTRSPVIANQTYPTNSAARTFTLSSLYTNETSNTQYAVNTSSSGICQASISGGTLTLTPGSTVGTATITLVAWGAGQVHDLGTFTVTTARPVTTNPAPTTVGTIPSISAQVSSAAQRVNVASYFRDTDTLTYSAVSSNASRAAVSVSGSVVTVTPGSAAGIATITVTATDTASQTAQQRFVALITAAPPTNPAPTRVGTISNRTADTGGSAATLNIASYFRDTDALLYSAVSSNTGVVAVSMSGSVLTMTPGSTAGTSTITITATDTASQSITQTFTFTTSRPAPPPNPAPTTVGTIPNISVQVSTSALTYTASSYFSDTDTLTYGVQSSNTSVATASVSGATVTVTPGSTAGTATITITATDTASQSVSQTFTITTTAAPPPNPAPTRRGSISNRSAQVSSGATTLNIATYFTDTDALTYGVASSNTNVVAVSVSGSTITMTPGSTAGTSTITVTATDTASQSITQTFTFTTTAAPVVNPPPTRVGTIPNLSVQVSASVQTVAVASYFSDTDALTYAVQSSNIAVATVSVSGSTVSITPGATAGASTITVTATDTASQSIAQMFTFITTAIAVVNPAPTRVGTVPAQSWQAGTGPHTLSASGYFADTDALTYTISSSHSTIASALINEVTGAVEITAVAAGTATITITATDTANQTATQAFIVNVTSAEAPEPEPEVLLPTIAQQIPDQTIETGETKTILMAQYFNNSDAYFATSRNTRSFYAEGHQAGVTIIGTQFDSDIGTGEVVVNAINQEAEADAFRRGVFVQRQYATQSFNVTVVRASSVAPFVTTRETDFSGYLRSDDPPIVISNPRKFFQWTGTGTSTLTATSGDTRIATVVYDSVADTLTITPVRGGYVSIEITLETEVVTTAPPAVPSELFGWRNLMSSSVTFYWSAAARATGYDLYITTPFVRPTAQTTPTASVGAVTEYTRTGLSPSTTYYAWIRAKNAVGASDWTETTFTTQAAAAPGAPPVPSNFRRTARTVRASDISFTLSWNAAAGATSYEIYWSQSTTPPTAQTAASRTQTTTTYSDTQALAATWYYWLRARNSSGASEWSSRVTVARRQVPAVPANFARSSNTHNSIVYTWTAATGATGYDLYVTTSATAPTSSTSPTASVGTVTTYTRTGLSASTTYRAYIRAKNSDGAGNWSSAVAVTTSAAPVQAPPVPTNLSSSSATATNIVYTWTAAARATGYDLYISTTNTAPTSGTAATASVGAVTTYTRTGLSASTTYYAWIRAKNTGGNSAWSSVYSRTTSSSGRTIPAPTGLGLYNEFDGYMSAEWSAVSVTPTPTYEFYYAGRSTPPTSSTVPTVAGLTGTSWGGRPGAGSYWGWVRARSGTDVSAWSAAAMTIVT